MAGHRHQDQAAVAEQVEAAFEAHEGLVVEVEGHPVHVVGELAGQHGRRDGDAAEGDFIVGRPYRYLGEVGQAGSMVPVAVGEEDAVDPDPVAIQLVADRRDLAVAQQRFVVPGHLGLELLVHLTPERGVEQQRRGMVFDQYGDVVGDGLFGPGSPSMVKASRVSVSAVLTNAKRRPAAWPALLSAMSRKRMRDRIGGPRMSGEG